MKNAGSGLWYAQTHTLHLTRTHTQCYGASPHDMQLLRPHFIVSEFFSVFMPRREELKWNVPQMTRSLSARSVQTLVASVRERLRWNGPQKAC